MRGQLTEAEFRLLLAIEAARGDQDGFVDELKAGGLEKRQAHATMSRTALRSLRSDGLIKTSETGDHLVLTDGGRQACREKIEALGELVRYGRATLRW